MNKTRQFIGKNCLLGILLCLSSTAEAESYRSLAHPPSVWSRAAIGFASDTSAPQKGGSLFQLEAGIARNRWLLGWRTEGSGDQVSGDKRLRLGTGPTVSFRLTTTLVVRASVLHYQEEIEVGYQNPTSLSRRTPAPSNEVAATKGFESVIGWERRWEVFPGLSWAWGGFVSHYKGRHATAPGRSKGFRRGIHLSLMQEIR